MQRTLVNPLAPQSPPLDSEGGLKVYGPHDFIFPQPSPEENIYKTKFVYYENAAMRDKQVPVASHNKVGHLTGQLASSPPPFSTRPAASSAPTLLEYPC